MVLFRFFSLSLLVLLSNQSFSNEYCKLFAKNKTPSSFSQGDIYTFQNHNLVCSQNSVFKKKFIDSKPVSDYFIIRTHINEISSENILASTHGYHLVSENYNCQSHHCNHINVFPLKEFNNINTGSQAPISKNSTVSSLVNQINSNLWKSDVVTLSSWSRISTTSDNDSAQVWIANKMHDLGLQTSTQEFLVFGNPTNNIIGIKTGTSRSDDWYIVGAHMDSIPSNGPAPGAIDNASGCAGVLEMARIASQFTFEATILFICYSGEEQGLIGSSHHVNTLINDGNQNKVKAALTMDMIGYTRNSSEYQLLLESSSSNQWLIDILAQNANTYAPNLDVFTSTNPFGSDHMPYINNNMHGILSIDDDWSIYPDYHRSTDLPENLNLTQGEYILKTNLAALTQLATILDPNDYIFYNSFE